MFHSLFRLSSVARHVSRATPLLGKRATSFLFKRMYLTEERGSPNTPDYRLFFRNESGPISPFHDIPLAANNEKTTFNMVVEVPRWTNAKMEISKEELLNPIKQDVKNGKLRFVANCFPHHGYIWNYGALPQTWENPNEVDSNTGCKGDNDPIDVCEIGRRVAKRGEVLEVKVLGAIALLDEGETDWKIIAIDINDPLAAQLEDIRDVEKHMPGFLSATVEWFRVYKIPDGKPPNKFAFNGVAKPHDFALQVIQETHEQWKKMIAGQVDCTVNSTCVIADGAPFKISVEEACLIVDKQPKLSSGPEIESAEVDKWHYICLNQ